MATINTRMYVFKKYPEFIDTDPRRTRDPTAAYQVTEKTQQTRHDCYFDGVNLDGKRVLDLGSCVSATGAYVLDKGAAFYQGVEIQRNLYDLADKNLSMRFCKTRWGLDNASLTEFFSRESQQFDIVVASGIIYASYEPHRVLQIAAKNIETVILESVHPYRQAHKRHSAAIEMLKHSEHWQDFVENEPIVVYDLMQMSWGNENNFMMYNSALPSQGYVKQVMSQMGFEEDTTISNIAKERLPMYYNLNDRYVMRFHRVNSTVPVWGIEEEIRTGSPRIK